MPKKAFSEHPRSAYWHPTKNGALTPQTVSHGSAIKCWFTCPNKACAHDFQADPNHITALKNPTWCPYCCPTPKKLCEDDCKTCYDKSFASHAMARLWYQPKNGIATPRSISLMSNKTYWLKCEDISCNHIFDVSINNITCRISGCPYCAHKRLCEDLTCTACENRSFASHPRAAYWDTTRNGDKTPRMLFLSSSKPYWFICAKGHSFCDTLCHITAKKDPRWCGDCLKEAEVQARSDQYLMEAREFAKDRNGVLLSTTYTDMNRRLDWKCNACDHEWAACLSSIKQGSWCPNCAQCIPYTLEDCQRYAISKEGRCLSEVYLNRGTMMIWECKCGYQWNSTYGYILSGTWCPQCEGRLPITLDDAKRLAEKKGGDCMSTEYISAKTSMVWRCKNRHTWNATYDNISSKSSWCPRCTKRHSKPSSEWLAMIQSGMAHPLQSYNSGSEYRIPHTRYFADGFDAVTNTIYEFHGSYYHGDPTIYQPTVWNGTSGKTMGDLYLATERKRNTCLDAGYRYVHIWESQWTRFKKTIIALQRRWRNLKKTRPTPATL